MATWPKDSPWRQGHVLKAASAKELKLRHSEATDGEADDTVVVVISHDCDIHPPPEREPHIEVLIGKEIHKEDGNFTYGKGSRTLHWRLSNGQEKILVELDARNKVALPKEALLGHEPAENVLPTAGELEILQTWLGSRYRRPSFPNAFVDRFESTGVQKDFKRIIEGAGKQLYAIYLHLEEKRELIDPDECYPVAIYLVYNVEPDGEKAKAAAEVAKLAIEGVFKAKCFRAGRSVNIELRECTVFADTEMTLFAMRRLKRWNTDHLSLKEAPAGEIPQ